MTEPYQDMDGSWIYSIPADSELADPEQFADIQLDDAKLEHND